MKLLGNTLNLSVLLCDTLKISVAYNNQYLFSCLWVYLSGMARISLRCASQVSPFSLDQWLVGAYSFQNGAQGHRGSRNTGCLLRSWPRTSRCCSVGISKASSVAKPSIPRKMPLVEGTALQSLSNEGMYKADIPAPGCQGLGTVTNLPHSLYLYEHRR